MIRIAQTIAQRREGDISRSREPIQPQRAIVGAFLLRDRMMMVQTIDSAMTVKRLRELADILESGRVELMSADIGINPCHDALLVSYDPMKTTYSTLCTISIETKRKAKQ